MNTELNTETFESRLEYVNEHRCALGYSEFKDITEEELVKHEALIDKHAQYGNDPWMDVPVHNSVRN